MTKAFLEMVAGKDRLSDLLGNVDIEVTVELVDSREEPVVVPAVKFDPEQLTVPPTKVRRRKSPK